jgi:uncharacterized protein (DUF58 family)
VAVPGLEWAYANHARMAVLFLSLASLLLLIGIAAVAVFGLEGVVAASYLLIIAVFVLAFTLLVFVSRIAKRGAVSFSIYSRRSIDDAEQAVRAALEADGRTAQVRLVRSRSQTPARIVSADGVSARFRIEVTRHAATAEPGIWTEIIEVFPKGERPEARALRAKILEGLRSSGPLEP